MAQPAFKIDVLQIEPAATGTRTVSRNSSTGGLKFIDPAFPDGLLLTDMVGTQHISGTSIVGTGGGAQWTSIQDAINAAPTNSSSSLPYVVLIFQGTYTENITISQNGIVLVGTGYVKITNSTTHPTVTIIENTGKIPLSTQLRNLTIENTEAASSCIHVDGSNTFASATATVSTSPLAAGDTLVIGGATLTGRAGARTAGGGNFNATAGTVDLIAADIVAAIMDTANAFVTSVTATSLAGVVTLTAVTPGSGGNAITLSSVTSPSNRITLSGATFAGGGGLGSAVGSQEILIQDCTLLATGVGTMQLDTGTVNNLRIQGGTFYGSSSTSLCRVVQTASFQLISVAWVNDLEVGYDTGNARPSIVTSVWAVRYCGRVGAPLINLIGAGSTEVTCCPVVGNLIHNGNRSFTATGCGFGQLTIEDTVVAKLKNCTRGVLDGLGTPTVAESVLTGTVSFVASVVGVVTFDRLQPDTSYAVYLDCPVLGQVPQVTSKTTTGFTIASVASLTATVTYTVIRQMS